MKLFYGALLINFSLFTGHLARAQEEEENQNAIWRAETMKNRNIAAVEFFSDNNGPAFVPYFGWAADEQIEIGITARFSKFKVHGLNNSVFELGPKLTGHLPMGKYFSLAPSLTAGLLAASGNGFFGAIRPLWGIVRSNNLEIGTGIQIRHQTKPEKSSSLALAAEIRVRY